MDIVAEEWRAIEGMEGYEVSNLGAVRSIDRTQVNSRGVIRRLNGRVLRQANHNAGYLSLSFCGRPSWLVHRLVANAWIGPIPDGYDVNHIDGNKKNNVATNLEYVTRRGNMEHARRTGLWDNRGEGNGQCRSTEEQIRVACALIAGGMSQTNAAKRVGVSAGTIGNARLGVNWAHLNIKSSRLSCPSKVPESKINEVRRLYSLGLSQSEIQRRTGVSKGSIHRAIHRKGATA